MSKWSWQPLQDRLEYRIKLVESGCWEWQGCRNRLGYGVIFAYGRTRGAHRAMYMLVNGDPGDHLVIDHLCRNPGCVNPYHLEAVTQRVNCQRGKGSITHCKRGHPLSGDNLSYGNKGERKCKACHAGRERERRKDLPRPTSCLHGHEYMNSTTVIGSDGRRICLICRLDRQSKSATRQASSVSIIT